MRANIMILILRVAAIAAMVAISARKRINAQPAILASQTLQTQPALLTVRMAPTIQSKTSPVQVVPTIALYA